MVGACLDDVVFFVVRHVRVGELLVDNDVLFVGFGHVKWFGFGHVGDSVV